MHWHRVVDLGTYTCSLERLSQLADRITTPDVPDAEQLAAAVLVDGLLLALHGAGWAITAPPAEPVAASQGEYRLIPHIAVGKLLDGEISAQEWTENAKERGIDMLPLGDPARVPAAA